MEETTILQGRTSVAQLGEESRATFIARTYVHLLGAVILFTAIEVFLFTSDLAYSIASALLGTSWLLVLGGFVLLGWLARRAAHTAESKPLQYAALVGYIIGESIIFVPLLVMIEYRAGGGVIESAALLTLVGFTGLTAVVFTTRKDFSFLKGVLRWGGIVALMLIIGGVFFGLQLGTFFSVAMIALAGCAVLYDTSKILHHHPEDRYVGAALELFASIALMFWYILRLLSRR